jgi:prophage regulatory protein
MMATTRERPTRMLRLKDVIDRVGLCRSTIYDRMALRAFPRGLKIGKSTRWLESDIEDFIAASVAGREWGEPWAPIVAARASSRKLSRRSA